MADKDIAPKGLKAKQAYALGFTFFMGNPCKRGHAGKRYAISGECVECCLARALKQQRDDPEYAQARNRRSQEKDPERYRRWQQTSIDNYLAKPGNLEKKRQRTRDWQRRFPEKVKEACADWRLRNLEYDRARCRKFIKNHPEEARASCARRRARLKGAAGSHTVEEIMALLEAQGGLCAGPGCGCNIMDCWTLDHKTPLVRDGSDDIGNLQLLCRPCNSSKGSRTMEEWTGRRIAA